LAQHRDVHYRKRLQFLAGAGFGLECPSPTVHHYYLSFDASAPYTMATSIKPIAVVIGCVFIDAAPN
jgi:hypothetical protein